MLYLLSPAKSLDFETPLPAALQRRATEPQFGDRAAELVAVLRRKTPVQVAQLMKLSDPLAALNVARYAVWQRAPAPAIARPAVMAFDGDVYVGLQARTLSTAELAWAQAHLVILSGLYGLLRPLDRVQPYRLEMGTALRTRRGRNLYAFWGDTLVRSLNQRLAEEGSAEPVLVNLASVEYAKAVVRPELAARVVDCVFEDWKDGRYRIIAFYAKRARGAMARWAIRHRVARPPALAGFDTDGYAFDAAVSSPDRMVFRRRTT